MQDYTTIVFTTIQGKFPQELKDKYKMDESNFTTEIISETPATFPLIYIHLLPGNEIGVNLDNSTLNAGLYTFEVSVIDNSSQNRANEVIAAVVDIMKSMRFTITAMPEINLRNNTYYAVARFRRAIANDDVF